jgi:hypothetical protein
VKPFVENLLIASRAHFLLRRFFGIGDINHVYSIYEANRETMTTLSLSFAKENIGAQYQRQTMRFFGIATLFIGVFESLR